MSRRNRRIVAAGLAVLAILATAACSAESGGGADGPQTIDLWTHAGGNDAELEVINTIVDDFNAQQDRYTVKIQDFPQDAYNDAVVAAASSGNLPCIVDVDSPNVANWVWAGYIQPLGLPEETFEGQLAGTLGRVDGEVYAYGYFDVALAMFSRQSTLDDAGVRVPTVDDPWTKDEFRDALAAIDKLDRFDYALDMSTGGTGEWISYGYSPQLQSFGGDLIDRSDFQSAKGALNGPEALEWARWFRGLVEDGYMAQTSGEDATADFVNGTSGLLYTGNWADGTVKEAFDDAVVLPPPDFGTGPKIGAGSWQWALAKGCDDVDGAREYLKFAHDTKYFVQYAKAVGLIPATLDAAAEIPAYAEGGENRIYLEMADRFAVVRPETPAYPYISSAFEKATSDILAGGDPQSILDRAVADIDRDIRQNGGYHS
ncbi:ABC transporter substrate-binding protein [Parafrankia sp. EUN1f]|uniref:ABC transporter substrate-binding protein n=1 Tax=Parafrankia sp. EUN1f TaxID=102897 RepID=UPI0001C46304|nr:extracellular solute-binding protein [Parafrankia sp. EUN1f]EFC82202.1 extracellular solute-binding protein family 1 [Parafrankia sp. EUN1f]